MGNIFSCVPSTDDRTTHSDASESDVTHDLPLREIIRVKPCRPTTITGRDAHEVSVIEDYRRCCGPTEDEDEIKPSAEAEARRGIAEVQARTMARKRLQAQQMAREREKAVEATLKRLDEGEGNRCVICLEAEASHLVVPCGHQCLCGPCSEHYNGFGEPCPLCRVPVQMTLKVFRAEMNAVAAFKQICQEEGLAEGEVKLTVADWQHG